MTSETEPQWGAVLQGHPHDLEDWAEVLAPPFDPWVERIMREDGEHFVLRGSALSGLPSAEAVQDSAAAIVSQLNGAMAIERGSEPVRCCAAAEFKADGMVGFTYSVAVHARARARAHAVAVAYGADGKVLPQPPPAPSAPQRWMAVSENSDDVAGLLGYVGRADNWFDLYMAIEMAEGLAGGEHELSKLPGVGGARHKTVKATANFYRHAKAYCPPKPATLAEGHAWLLSVARAVLERRQ